MALLDQLIERLIDLFGLSISLFNTLYRSGDNRQLRGRRNLVHTSWSVFLTENPLALAGKLPNFPLCVRPEIEPTI